MNRWMKNMLRLSVVLFFLIALGAAFNEEGYDGFKLFEIVPETEQQTQFLYDLSQKDELYDFFVLRRIPNEPAHVMVHRNEIQNFLNNLALHKLSYKILNEDVGRSAEKDFQLSMQSRTMEPFAIDGRLRTDRYYNHKEINNYIEHLAQRYPSRVVVKHVGKSFMGRDIKTIAISNGDGRTDKKVIFMDAGIHAREWIAPATILYVIEQLVENFEENAELLQDYDFIILPVVNPDGYEYTQLSANTRYWRKTRQPYKYGKRTCYGTDANRNFGPHWNEGGSSSNPCSDTFAGPYAFSEPEAVVLADLINTFKDRGVFYLTLHSYGNFLVYPYGFTYELPEGVSDLDEIANVGANAIFSATGVQYKTGSVPTVLYIASGSSQDYAYELGFKVALTMELSAKSGSGGLTGFAPEPSEIDSMVKEAWIGIRAMSKRVIEKYSML